MERTLISIIIPIYNTASWLSRCLNSILSQNVDNCELLLIDDGSSDGSETICDDYASQYTCVKVFHQVNQGVSAARNHGIKTAKGDYLWFVDSDDRVLPGAIQKLLDVIEASTPELIVFPAIQEDEYQVCMGIIPAPDHGEYKQDGPLCSGDSLYPFTHVVRRDLIADMLFDTSLSLMEDRDFFYRVCSSVSERVLIIRNPLYAYLITRKDSAINSLPVENYISANEVQYQILISELKSNRPIPSYRFFAAHTLGVLALIFKTGECYERIELLRERLLSFDDYSASLTGRLRLKYEIFKRAPLLYKIVYVLYARFQTGKIHGSTVLIRRDG